MPNFKCISFEMAELKGVGRICPHPLCVVLMTLFGIELKMTKSDLTGIMAFSIIHEKKTSVIRPKADIGCYGSVLGQFVALFWGSQCSGAITEICPCLFTLVIVHFTSS